MPRSALEPFVVCSLDTKWYAVPGTKVTPVEKLLLIPPPTPTKERSSVPRGAPMQQPPSTGLSRSSRSTLKSFVVCSLDTKRCADPRAKMTPVEKLQPIVASTSTGNGPSVPRVAPAKQTHRTGSLPSVVPKTEPRHPSVKPMSIPVPNPTTRVQKSSPLPLVTSKDQSLHKKTFVPKPLKLVQRVPGPVRSTQFIPSSEPAPSRIPRYRISPSSLGVTAASKGKQDVTAQTAWYVKLTGASVKKPVVWMGGEGRPGMLTRNWRPAPPEPIAYTYAVKLATHVRVVWSLTSVFFLITELDDRRRSRCQTDQDTDNDLRR